MRSTLAELDSELLERLIELFADERRGIHVLREDQQLLLPVISYIIFVK